MDLDNMTEDNDDTAGSTPRSKMSDAVLQDVPTLSDHDGNATDLGQRNHALNASGYGSWPYIVTFELSTDNVIEYGNNSVNVEFGNTDDETSISLTNANPAGSTEIHLTLTDPALNIDPTTADIWIFDLSEDGSGNTTIFANNGTNTALTLSLIHI